MKIYKLKPGKEVVFKNWTQQISTTYLHEAVESLKEENCTRELFIMFCIDNNYYVAAHMEGDNILPSNREREINITHKTTLAECVESVVPYESLFDISVLDTAD